jgi:hypothetical protein
MKTLFKERAKRFYGNQHVKRWIRNPLRKYVINPTVKATKVTGFIIVSVFVLMLVATSCSQHGSKKMLKLRRMQLQLL